MGKKRARARPKKRIKKTGAKKAKKRVKRETKEKAEQIKRSSDWVLMSIMVLLFIAIVSFIFLFSRSISICGDGKCNANECNSCAKDCSFRNCLDGVCQTFIGENCHNSGDCACGPGEKCDIYSERADSKGCFASISNVLINVQDITEEVSVSTLYKNHMLNDGLNNHALMNIIVKNIGESNVSNIVLNLKILDYVSDMIVLGSLEKDKLKIFKWNPRFNENVLETIDDTDLDISIKLSYSDEANQEHTVSKKIPLSVLGKNQLGKYGSYKDFMTYENPLVQDITKDMIVKEYNTKNDILRAAREVWDKINDLGIVVSDDKIGYVQYPEETINSKKGDGEDIAVLYASLLKNLNVKPVIIKTSDKVFAGFHDNSGYVYPIDTKLMGETFHYAWTLGFKAYVKYTNADDIEVIDV